MRFFRVWWNSLHRLPKLPLSYFFVLLCWRRFGLPLLNGFHWKKNFLVLSGAFQSATHPMEILGANWA